MSGPAIPKLQPTWHYKPKVDDKRRAELMRALNTSKAITTLLLQCNITSPKEAKAFLTPALSMLHDPHLMKGMGQAVDRIAIALQHKQRICIYGDYDVDGVTATALLYKTLAKAGANIGHYIRGRHTEGYGVSDQGIDHCIQTQVGLLITIDYGIRAVAKVQKAVDANIDVIVCDHHEPGPCLPPALAILNPKQRDCPYPYKFLSGCGIGYKLLQGLVAKKWLPPELLEGVLDLVAVSIAADMVPMTGENRVLAALGLRQLEENPSVGLGVLAQQSRRKPPYAISDVVFRLAPPINAAGRVGHAAQALELILAEDVAEAQGHAVALFHKNRERKEIEAQVFQEALAAIAADAGHAQRYTTLLFKPQWHKGVLGIVAAHCVEKYYRPTIILTRQGAEATGSARSIPGCNILEALTECEELLLSYGGHAYAAGVTLHVKDVSAFRQRFEEVMQRTLTPAQLIPKQVIDLPLRLAEINPAFYGVLQRMQPFGPQNRCPVFSTAPVFVTHYEVYKREHLSLKLHEAQSTRIWHAIGFNMAHLQPHVAAGEALAIAYTIQANTYKGHRRYELSLKGLRPYRPS